MHVPKPEGRSRLRFQEGHEDSFQETMTRRKAKKSRSISAHGFVGTAIAPQTFCHRAVVYL